MTEKSNFDEDLHILLEKTEKSEKLSIGEILEVLSDKGRIFLMIFLSLPFCQPIQIPGLSTPFGLVIALLGYRMAFRKNFLLPKRVMDKTVSSETIHKIADKCLKLMKKLSPLIRPRMKWLYDHRIMHISNGLTLVLMGILLALPLPIPFTNLTAGWAIFLLSLGLLEEDGVFILLGYAVSIATVVFFIILAFSVTLIF